MPRILLIDGNNLCWVSAYTTGHLSYRGVQTGVLYGFFKQILSLGAKIKPSFVVYCWDSRKSKRMEIFPDYKKKRKELKPEEQAFKEVVMRQLHFIKDEVLPKLGFKNSFLFDGYEADDIIASVCQLYPSAEIHILSSDNDLYQLLNDNVILYSPRDIEHPITKQSFIDTYGIQPEQWVEVKKIAGCPTDGVPGIPRVGEKTALKYLRGELNPQSSTYKKIVSDEGKRIQEFNEKLVKLPFDLLDIELRSDKIHKLRYIHMCKKYGFKSFLEPEEMEKAEVTFRLR